MRGINHPIAQREADRLRDLNRVRRAALPQWQRDMEDANYLRTQAREDAARRANQRRRGGLRL